MPGRDLSDGHVPYVSPAKDLLEAIYTRFILRDVMSKVVPGLTLLVAAAYALGWREFPAVPAWVGWVVIGHAWILGFVVQGFGQWSGLILHEPKSGHLLYEIFLKLSHDEPPHPASRSTQNDHERRLKFLTRAQSSPDASQQRERYLVIKEAAGNSYVCALLVAALLVAQQTVLFFLGSTPATRLQAVLVIAAFALVGVVLFYVHMNYVRRQWDWEETVLNEPRGDARDPTGADEAKPETEPAPRRVPLDGEGARPAGDGGEALEPGERPGAP